MSEPLEIRMPRYPDCWETCGTCGSGDVIVETLLVRPGDTIKADDSILILETGKVALDIPSPKDGRVLEIFVGEGEPLAEGQLILTLLPG